MAKLPAKSNHCSCKKGQNGSCSYCRRKELAKIAGQKAAPKMAKRLPAKGGGY